MTEKLRKYIKKLIKAGEQYDEELIRFTINKAKEDSYELSLIYVDERVDWEVNGSNRNAIMHIEYELQLGGSSVANWFSEYVGEYGDMGTGWWISEIESTQPDGIDEILSVAEIEIKTPDVPEPESLDDFEDEDEDEDEDNLVTDNIAKQLNFQDYNYSSSDDFDTLSTKAAQGDPRAQLLIGHAYEEGCYSYGGVSFSHMTIDQNYALAVKFYRMAAEQGNTEAMYQLGVKYTGCTDENSNIIIVNDNDEVSKWLHLAAEAGHAGAQNFLGWMYREGEYTHKNQKEAIKWCTLAAAQGHQSSQSRLGAMYNLGEGVEQNYSESMKLFNLAAAQGNADAQFNIGWMYDKGQGVPINKIMAKKWYKIACNNGHELGCEYLWKFKKIPDID